MKSCVVEPEDKNVKHDTAIPTDLEKISHFGIQNYNCADVLAIIQHKRIRRLRSFGHTSSTPVPIQKAKTKPISLPQPCCLNTQKKSTKCHSKNFRTLQIKPKMHLGAHTKLHIP